MSLDSIAILILGLILGLAYSPGLALGGYIAERVCQSYLAQTVIALFVWGLCMLLWAVLLGQIDIGLWSYTNRRAHSYFLLFGIIIGVFLSQRIVDRFKGESD